MFWSLMDSTIFSGRIYGMVKFGSCNFQSYSLLQKNKFTSLRKAFDSANIHDLFNLPVSVEANDQMQARQFESSELVLWWEW